LMTETHQLSIFVADFAAALQTVDARKPQYVSRSGRAYQPGIGPFAEDKAVDLITREMKTAKPGVYDTLKCQVAYAGLKQKCDLVIDGEDPLRIEIKMARFFGDNGKPDDTGIKDILSPFRADRSAVADAVKLTRASSAGAAVLIYGFDAPDRPLVEIIEAFEAVASLHVQLGPRQHAAFADLVHPVHRAGGVFAWRVQALTPPTPC
jgi:hypothetical protein